MQTKLFNVRGQPIRCEIYESEIDLDRRNQGTIRLLTFAFEPLHSEVLMALGAQLWPLVTQRFRELARADPGRQAQEVIGRISFECDGARVEHEFSRPTPTDVATLIRIAAFVRQYPDAEEIRVSRDGPILVRFRNLEPEPPPPGRGGSVLAQLPASIAGLRKGLASVFHRRG